MIISLVMRANSVATGHPSVVVLAETVGPIGTVELPVGKGGEVTVAFDEVDSSRLNVPERF